jgi:hypothetical protein
MNTENWVVYSVMPALWENLAGLNIAVLVSITTVSSSANEIYASPYILKSRSEDLTYCIAARFVYSFLNQRLSW